MSRPNLLLLALGILSGLACNQSQPKPSEEVGEAYLTDPASVGFDLERVGELHSPLRMNATYVSQGKSARFTIELGSGKTTGPSELPIQFGKGRFVSEPGSDASVLLADLRKALEAKHLPKGSARLSSLPFEFAILGENQSQLEGGGFLAKPPLSR